MDLPVRIVSSGFVQSTACLAALVFATGCDGGPQTVPVEGKVLLDGEPLTQGSVRFVSDTGRPAGSAIGEDGSFKVVSISGNDQRKIVGLVPGRYRISVKATEMLGEEEDAEVLWIVPKRYADTRTSGLLADIAEPTKNLTLKLASGESKEEDAETKDP